MTATYVTTTSADAASIPMLSVVPTRQTVDLISNPLLHDTVRPWSEYTDDERRNSVKWKFKFPIRLQEHEGTELVQPRDAYPAIGQVGNEWNTWLEEAIEAVWSCICRDKPRRDRYKPTIVCYMVDFGGVVPYPTVVLTTVLQLALSFTFRARYATRLAFSLRQELLRYIRIKRSEYRIYVSKGAIVALADNTEPIIPPVLHHKPTSLCGLRVKLASCATNGREGTRIGTIGGVIWLDERPFCLLSAHCLQSRPVPEHIDDGSAESDAEEDSVVSSDDEARTSLSSESGERKSIDLQENARHYLDLLDYQNSLVAVTTPKCSLLASSNLCVIGLRKDWALFEPLASFSSLTTNSFRYKERQIRIRSVRPLEPGMSTVLVRVSALHQPQQVWCSPTRCRTPLPTNQRFHRAFGVYGTKFTPGDSGAWIVDVDSEALVGIMVMASENMSVGIMLPAEDVLADITSENNNVSPPSISQFPSDKIETSRPSNQSSSAVDTMLVEGKQVSLPASTEYWSSMYSDNAIFAGLSIQPEIEATYRRYEEMIQRAERFRRSTDPIRHIGDRWAFNDVSPTYDLAVTKQHSKHNVPDDTAEPFRIDRALQTASLKGDLAAVQRLLDQGAKIDTEDGHYISALQAASARGHLTIVQLLLDKGASVDLVGLRIHYNSALQAAAAAGHLAIVELLLESGAKINAIGGNRGSALRIAIENGHWRVVELLRSHERNEKPQQQWWMS